MKERRGPVVWPDVARASGRHGRGFSATISIIAAVLAVGAASAQSSSDHYILRQWSANSAGAASTSDSFRLTFSLGQKAPVGASSAFPYLQQSGFWSFAGTGPIPVVLAVDRNRSEPRNCDLHWSGNDAPYDIYAGDCSDVFGSFLTSSSGNSLLNVDPPGGSLACFIVVSASSATTSPPQQLRPRPPRTPPAPKEHRR